MLLEHARHEELQGADTVDEFALTVGVTRSQPSASLVTNAAISRLQRLSGKLRVTASQRLVDALGLEPAVLDVDQGCVARVRMRPTARPRLP